jgi:hypothetical protein
MRTMPTTTWKLFAFGAAITAGCGSSQSGATTAEMEEAHRPVRPRPACEPSAGQVVGFDVNDDGVVDTRDIMVGGRKQCSLIDVNFDGRSDVLRYFAADGSIEREEHDFDFDGKVDQVAWFEGGAVKERLLDTNFDSMFDTWLECSGSAVVTIERDRRRTGYPDVWETYANGRISEAHYDENGDRRVDKWEIFREGRIATVRFDRDFDGEPDEENHIPPEEAGQADMILTCDGSTPTAPPAAPAAPAAAAPAPAAPAPTTASTEGGTP